MSATPEAPLGFDRRHAVSLEQEQAWTGHVAPPLTERPPSVAKRALRRVGVGLDNSSVWVPQTTPRYAAILDHGIRSETHGVVLHVNSGWYKGTIGFFTNGQPEPWGSEGVGAHFEIGGHANRTNDEYSDGPPIQFLPIDRVAWHAVDANGFTIGVEHAGFGRSRAEWLTTHYNEIGQSAYRVAWILRRYSLGPPKVSTIYPGPKGANVWPHSAGGLSWGGHACPGSTYPWDVWSRWCLKAYNARWCWK